MPSPRTLPSHLLRPGPLALLALAPLLSTAALAQDATTGPTTTEDEKIIDFRLNSIKGIPDSIDFADRFGPGSTRHDFEHKTNIADCPAYNLEVGTTAGALEQVTGAAEHDAGATDAGGRDDATVGGTDTGSGTGSGECTLSDTEPRVEMTWTGDSTTYAGTSWRAFVGSCTQGTDLNGDLGSSCYRLMDDVESYSSSGNSFEVPLALLIGTQKVTGESTTDDRRCCSEVTTAVDGNTVSLWIGVTDPTGLGNPVWQKVTFGWDYVAPGAPGGVTVDDAGETIDVSWSAPSSSSEDHLEYTVYWDTQSFSARGEAASSKSVSGKLTSTELTGLSVGETYYIGVAASDDYDNDGPLSSVVTGSPVETQDGFERYKAAGGAEEGGFCFVATAAYGSPIHPHVMLLRNFRDSWLLTNEPGRAFVRFYYTNGPAWASFVEVSNPLRVLVQVALVPLLLLAWFLVKLTLLEQALLVASLWMMRRVARELLRRRYGAPAPLVAESTSPRRS